LRAKNCTQKGKTIKLSCKIYFKIICVKKRVIMSDEIVYQYKNKETKIIFALALFYFAPILILAAIFSKDMDFITVMLALVLLFMLVAFFCSQDILVKKVIIYKDKIYIKRYTFINTTILMNKIKNISFFGEIGCKYSYAGLSFNKKRVILPTEEVINIYNKIQDLRGVKINIKINNDENIIIKLVKIKNIICFMILAAIAILWFYFTSVKVFVGVCVFFMFISLSHLFVSNKIIIYKNRIIFKKIIPFKTKTIMISQITKLHFELRYLKIYLQDGSTVIIDSRGGAYINEIHNIYKILNDLIPTISG
jgi:hypothetical protein